MNPISPKLISITGPESSGKTTLAETLAKELGAHLVEEQSRVYFQNHAIQTYGAEAVYRIAEMQWTAEQEGLASGKAWVIADTDVFTLRIWLEWKQWEVPEFIHRWMHQKTYQMVLLCTPDLGWTFDPLRENPEEADRKRLFELYLQRIQESGMSYGIVSGTGALRRQQAMRLLEPLF